MKLNFDKSLIIGLMLIVLIILGGIWLKKPGSKSVEIITDRQEYDNGGSLRLRIRNLLAANVCFSSCYPYYLEWKADADNSGNWDVYSYQSCPYNDQIKECIGPGATKAFGISLPLVKEGVHRFLIPTCQNCEQGEAFQESGRFYSNEFEVK